MAHKITDTDRVLSVAGTEWHGLAEHREELRLPDLRAVWGEVGIEDLTHNGNPVPDTRAVTIDGKPIAAVGTRYVPLPSEWVVEAASRILEVCETAKLSTIGTVDAQRDAFVCIDLGREINVGRDNLKPYFSIIDNRTGRRKLTLGNNATRSVCANTVGVARRELRDNETRHNREMAGFISRIVADFQDHLAEIDDHRRTVEALADRRLTASEGRAYVEKFLGEEPSDDASTRARNAWESGRNFMRETIERESDLLGIPKNSAWLTYNAVTNWAQHERSVRGSREAANLTGSGAEITREAWDSALALI